MSDDLRRTTREMGSTAPKDLFDALVAGFRSRAPDRSRWVSVDVEDVVDLLRFAFELGTK